MHGGVLLVATSYYCEWAGGGRWLLAASPAPGPAVPVAPAPWAGLSGSVMAQCNFFWAGAGGGPGSGLGLAPGSYLATAPLQPKAAAPAAVG